MAEEVSGRLDPAKMTREQLLEEVGELELDLRERDDEIQRLTRELLSVKSGVGGRSRSIDDESLERENEELRERLSKEETDGARHKEQLSEMSAQLKILVAEKIETEDDFRASKIRVSELEKELIGARDSSRNALMRSQDVTKQKTENQKQQLQLLQENENIQNENKELTARVAQLDKDKAALEEVVTKLAEDRDELDAQLESADVAREMLENRLQDMHAALEVAENNLQEVEHSELSLKNKLEQLQSEVAASRERDAAALAKALADADAYKRQVAELRDTTAVGTKQAEIDALRVDRSASTALVQELRAQLREAAGERDELAGRLVDYEEAISAEVTDRVASERQGGMVLERKLKAATERLEQEAERARVLEGERRLLSAQVDELNHWRAVYESGHGLQELARSQKKGKEDNRRLGIALEQVTRKLGEAIDGNGVLVQAFERLKRDAGRPADFAYDAEQLRAEVLGDNARLRAQARELEAQVEALETESVRVRRALKNQAGALGEQGFKYAGMDADMLVRVNDFAAALREGRDAGSADERPVELLRENARLKEEMRLLESKFELFERELGSGAGARGGTDQDAATTAAVLQSNGSELKSLRDDVRRLISENGDLKNRLSLMQDELMLVLGKHLTAAGAGGGGGTTGGGGVRDLDGLAALLLANNELLLGQLADRQQQQQQGVSDVGSEGRADDPRGLLHSPIFNSTRFSRVGLPPQGRGGTVRTLLGEPATPNTLQGRTLLGRTVAQMNLPPEEWASEVRELSASLVESLEQLFEREAELAAQRNLVEGLDRNLIAVKQQLATLYYDHSARSEAWRAQEAALRRDNAALHDERDDLRLRLRRTEETLKLLQREDPAAEAVKLRELSRRLTVYEVNEAVLSRKYTAQAEQLGQELQRRLDLEHELAAVESVLKRRVLYLEQAKLALGGRVEQLEARLSRAAPLADYREAHAELESLREDHLEALRREMDARVALLDAHGQAAAAADSQAALETARAELAKSRAQCQALTAQVEEQQRKLSLQRVSESVGESSAEVAGLLSDVSRGREQIGRLELDLSDARRALDSAGTNVRVLTAREKALVAEAKELRREREEAGRRETAVRASLLGFTLRYDAGLTRAEAEALRGELENCKRALATGHMEAVRLRELAEVASRQAQAVVRARHQGADEAKQLLEYCGRVESRGDDDLLIGRLQRQLMTTKASYRVFAHKYHLLRGDCGQRELVIRALEHRLDERESAAFTQQQRHRAELAVVKGALRDMSEGGGAGGGVVEETDSKGPVKIGRRIASISHKMGQVAELTNVAVAHTLELEERGRALGGAVQDLEAERDLLAQRCADLALLNTDNTNTDNTNTGKKKKGGGKASGEQEDKEREKEGRRQVAARLVGLSEELRGSMLAALRARREAGVLAQEKGHLQALLASYEASVRDLEESKVRGDSNRLLLEAGGAGDSATAAGAGVKENEPRSLADLEELLFRKDPLFPDLAREVQRNAFNADLSSEELLAKLQHAGERLSVSKQETEQLRAQSQRRLQELQEALDEQSGVIQYYEGVLQREGLPTLQGHPPPPQRGVDSGSSTTRQGPGRRAPDLREEQEQIQAAASATIGSLRALLDEKNEALERLRERLARAEGPGAGRVRSAADRNAQVLLSHLDADAERRPVSAGGGGEGGSEALLGNERRLLSQIEAADELLADRERTVHALESKLAAQSNARERAEMRCGAALEEMAAMKEDMVTLLSQLQQARGGGGAGGGSVARPALRGGSTGRTLAAATGEGKDDGGDGDVKPLPVVAASDKKVAELKKLVRTKEEKIRGYREIIVRLKDEFLKSEEQRALDALKAAGTGAGAGEGPAGRDKDSTLVNRGEMDSMRAQISALKEGLRAAKEDLEAAKKTREKLARARLAAQEEAERLDAQMTRAEAQAAQAQEALARTRKELEESRRKEAQLRNKLKDMADEVATGSGPGMRGEGKEDGGRLQKEVEVLRAQNAALRRAETQQQGKGPPLQFNDRQRTRAGDDDPPGTSSGARRTDPPGTSSGARRTDPHTATMAKTPAESKADDAPRAQSAPSSRPRVLGRAGPSSVVTGTVEESGAVVAGGELRAQQQAKWEAEKRVEKRVETLERRLQEKIGECEQLQRELVKARAADKPAAAAGQEGAGRRRGVSVDLVLELEQARGRVFELEEARAALRRRCEVDQANEIASLRQQLAKMRAEVADAEAEVEAARREVGDRGGRDGGRSLRASEDRFVRGERLAEELASMRRDKAGLESALLERDARALEMRFDLENAAVDLDRFRRRCAELEAVVRALGDKSAVPPERSLVPMSGGGGSRREQELEGVVEAMRKVVDKLKGENERLRRGGATTAGVLGAPTADDKKAAAEKRRADALDAELKAALVKLRAQEDVAQKLVQRQQQVALLRRQLKTKEDELTGVLAARRESEAAAVEARDRLQAAEQRAKDAEGRAAELETGRPKQRRDEAEVRRRLAESECAVEEMRAALLEAQQEVARHKLPPGGGGRERSGVLSSVPVNSSLLSSGGGGDMVRLLREENARLKEELAAFDLDFFEEIENLKYAHAEAVRKLRIFEQQQQQGGGGGGQMNKRSAGAFN